MHLTGWVYMHPLQNYHHLSNKVVTMKWVYNTNISKQQHNYSFTCTAALDHLDLNNCHQQRLCNMRTGKTKCNHTSLEINCNQVKETTRLWENTGQATCPREFNAPRIDQLLDKHTDEVLLNAHDQAGVDLFCLRPYSCFSCLAGAWGP